MPNHIANLITGPSLTAIREVLRGAESAVDFGALIPQPAGLSIDAVSHIETAAKVALNDWPQSRGGKMNDIIASLETSNMRRERSPLTFNDADWALFIQMLQNKRAHGHYHWYEWNVEHWGTKWNAYDVEDRADGLYFETAWSFPKPVMLALIERLPMAEFSWQYADEDYGRNLGIWTRSDGVLSESQPSGDQQEWAMRLHGYDAARIAEYRAEIAADEADAAAAN